MLVHYNIPDISSPSAAAAHRLPQYGIQGMAGKEAGP